MKESVRKRIWSDFWLQFVIVASLTIACSVIYPGGVTVWNMILPVLIWGLVIFSCAVDIWDFGHPRYQNWYQISLIALGLALADAVTLVVLLVLIPAIIL